MVVSPLLLVANIGADMVVTITLILDGDELDGLPMKVIRRVIRSIKSHLRLIFGRVLVNPIAAMDVEIFQQHTLSAMDALRDLARVDREKERIERELERAKQQKSEKEK